MTRGSSHLFVAKLEERKEGTKEGTKEETKGKGGVVRRSVVGEEGDVTLEEGLALAEDLAVAAITVYAGLVEAAVNDPLLPEAEVGEDDWYAQLAYHTLYVD